MALPAPACSHRPPPQHLPLFPVCPHQRPALVLIGGWGTRSESEPEPETPAVAGARKAWPHPHRHPSWFSAPFTSTWLLSRPPHAHAQAHTRQAWSEGHLAVADSERAAREPGAAFRQPHTAIFLCGASARSTQGCQAQGFQPAPLHVLAITPWALGPPASCFPDLHLQPGSSLMLGLQQMLRVSRPVEDAAGVGSSGRGGAGVGGGLGPSDRISSLLGRGWSAEAEGDPGLRAALLQRAQLHGAGPRNGNAERIPVPSWSPHTMPPCPGLPDRKSVV